MNQTLHNFFCRKFCSIESKKRFWDCEEKLNLPVIKLYDKGIKEIPIGTGGKVVSICRGEYEIEWFNKIKTSHTIYGALSIELEVLS